MHGRAITRRFAWILQPNHLCDRQIFKLEGYYSYRAFSNPSTCRIFNAQSVAFFYELTALRFQRRRLFFLWENALKEPEQCLSIFSQLFESGIGQSNGSGVFCMNTSWCCIIARFPMKILKEISASGIFLIFFHEKPLDNTAPRRAHFQNLPFIQDIPEPFSCAIPASNS